MMKEYIPYSKEVWEDIQKDVADGHLTVIDTQLSGACNAACEYCDTKEVRKVVNGKVETRLVSQLDISAIERLIKQGDVKYIFICGLGEPTAPGNLGKFKEILKVAKENGCRVSAFSNIVELDEDLFSYIEDRTLNVMVKLDSFVPVKVQETFGIDDAQTETYFSNLKRIAEIARRNDELVTHIAASVVFTQRNFDEAEEILEFCIDNGFYPLLGKLEKSGRCVGEKYDKLKLSDEQDCQILEIMTNLGVPNYQTAHCPANYGAVHINGFNQVVMDAETGLGCKWFSLEDNNECAKISFGDISKGNKTWQQLEDEIFAYRFSKYYDVAAALEEIEESPVIGGCGGTAKQVLTTHKQLTEQAAKSRGAELV